MSLISVGDVDVCVKGLVLRKVIEVGVEYGADFELLSEVLPLDTNPLVPANKWE